MLLASGQFDVGLPADLVMRVARILSDETKVVITEVRVVPSALGSPFTKTEVRCIELRSGELGEILITWPNNP